VLKSGSYWLSNFRNAYNFVKECVECQKTKGVITKRNQMLQQPIIFYEVFDVWALIL